MIFTKKWTDKTHPLVQTAIAYRQTHKIPEVGIDVVATTFGSNPIILQQKIDGESNLFEYRKGKLTLANKYGTIREYIKPLSGEFEKLMAELGVTQLLGCGELYALGRSGEKLPLNEVMHIIKAGDIEEESRIVLGIFDALEIDEKVIDGKYYERILFMNSLLGDAIKHVHTVFSTNGDANVIKDLWEKNVLGPSRWEGFVVRAGSLGEGGVFKIKYIGTIDALVIGAIKGTGKYSNTLGSLVLAMMDKDGDLLYCGKCGTGFNDLERKVWWDWCMLHVVKISTFEGEEVYYVKPERVIEVGYSFIATHPTPTYSWTEHKYLEDLKTVIAADYKTIPDKVGGVLQTPRYYRHREDKGFKYDDVRIEQMPLDTPEETMTEEQMRKKLLEEKFLKLRKRVGISENPEWPEYSDTWEADVVYELEKLIGVTTSDAQGLVEAQGDLMKKMFAEGTSALDAAKMIDKASRFDKKSGELWINEQLYVLTNDEVDLLDGAIGAAISEYEGVWSKSTIDGLKRMRSFIKESTLKENPIGAHDVRQRNELWLGEQMLELGEEEIKTLRSALWNSLTSRFIYLPDEKEFLESLYKFVEDFGGKNYSKEWAEASEYFAEWYPEYKQYEDKEWSDIPDEIQQEFVLWYDDSMWEARMASLYAEDNPKKWVREIKFLEKAQQKGKITPYLYDALSEIIAALKEGNIGHAANLTAVKSFICGTVSNLEHCPFGEDDKHNRAVLNGQTLYGHLDGLHFELSMATDTMPSGSMIIGSGGIEERKLVGGSPTLDRIQEDRRRTYAEVEKKMKDIEKENPSAIPSWYWMKSRVIPEVRYFE